MDKFPTAMSQDLTALGFDFGTQRIGVACGQTISGTAQALTTLPARDGIPDWNDIQKLIDTWQPDVLVIGLPFNMDGSESPMVARARKFANRLHGRFHLPCYGIDERLSSQAAEERLGKDSSQLDSEAARLILTSWLTELRTRNSGDSD